MRSRAARIGAWSKTGTSRCAPRPGGPTARRAHARARTSPRGGSVSQAANSALAKAWRQPFRGVRAPWGRRTRSTAALPKSEASDDDSEAAPSARRKENSVLPVDDLRGDPHSVRKCDGGRAAPQGLAKDVAVGLAQRRVNEEVRVTVENRGISPSRGPLSVKKMRSPTPRSRVSQPPKVALRLRAIPDQRQRRVRFAREDVAREKCG